MFGTGVAVVDVAVVVVAKSSAAAFDEFIKIKISFPSSLANLLKFHFPFESGRRGNLF